MVHVVMSVFILVHERANIIYRLVFNTELKCEQNDNQNPSPIYLHFRFASVM